jgi:hypothetical protein
VRPRGNRTDEEDDEDDEKEGPETHLLFLWKFVIAGRGGMVIVEVIVGPCCTSWAWSGRLGPEVIAFSCWFYIYPASAPIIMG